MFKNKQTGVFFKIALAVLLALCLGATAFAQSSQQDEIIQVMKILRIIEGDHNGNLNLDSNVTRAQFSKILIQASTLKESVRNTGMTTSPFPDMRNTHWASPYVYAATKNGYIKGYLDGTFRPDNNVNLEQAVTMVLRLLGYTDADLTGSYPDAQLLKYKDLQLDKNINATQGQSLTRKQCMQLIYNALCTKTKQGQVYCQTLGYTADTNGNIDLSALLSANTKGPIVLPENNIESCFPFDITTATVYKDGKKAENYEFSQYDVAYYSIECEAIWVYTDSATGILNSVSPNASNPTSVTLSGKTYSIETTEAKYKLSSFGEFEEDDFITLILGRNGTVVDVKEGDIEKDKIEDEDYFDILESTIEGPEIVYSLTDYQSKIPFDISKAQIYLDSKQINAQEIQENDVLYYSKSFNCVWVYRKAVSGIINSISPSKESPASVSVNGKNYTLSTVSSKYKVSSYGIYKEEDFVTLLVGRNGEVAEIMGGTFGDSDTDSDRISYTELVNSTLKGPFTVLDGNFAKDIESIDFSSALIYKNGKNITKEEINIYDVLYYSSAINTVWVYSDKESGIIDKILPDRALPSSVVISGNTYNIETNSAKLKVSSMGEYNVGDRVTVLKGRNGGVADIVSNETNVVSFIGIVSGFEKNKTFEDKDGVEYKSNVINVTLPDSSTRSLKTNATSAEKGKVVRCTLSGEKYVVSQIQKQYSTSDIEKLQNAMDKGLYANNCEILDVYNESAFKTVAYRELYGMKIKTLDVLYYELDGEGNIKSLILNDYTGDIHTYGYIYSGTLYDGDYTYKYVIDGNYSNYTTSGYIKNGGACFKYKNGEIDVIEEMTKLSDTSLADGYAIVQNSATLYPVDANATVYIVKDGKMTLSTLSHVQNGNYYTDCYIDDDLTRCGKVRVIVAKAK